jgi:hypothetical protein
MINKIFLLIIARGYNNNWRAAVMLKRVTSLLGPVKKRIPDPHELKKHTRFFSKNKIEYLRQILEVGSKTGQTGKQANRSKEEAFTGKRARGNSYASAIRLGLFYRH